ncbi:MAG: 5'-nucleotidase C-terminal domain-containing protein [Cyanobacteriota bacterium]
MNSLQGVVNQLNYNQYREQQALNNVAQQNVPVQSAGINASQSPSRLNTDAVYTTWQNPNSGPVNQNDAGLTLVHLNDNHRKVKGLAKFKTAINEIAKKVANSANAFLPVHSGDYNVGMDTKKLKLQIELLNDLGVKFAAIGNHEIDINPINLANELVNAKYVSLSSNLVMPEGCGLDKLVQSGKIAKSTVYQEKGHKYGLIGLSPPDLLKRLDPNSKMYGLNVLPREECVRVVQEEINKLKAQGINKIILVSHVGLDLDKEIAQNVDGLDIILGGHSHDLLNPLEPGVSLVNSKSNEPVLIFQNGKDAKYMGVTDAYFDDKGIVKAAIARQEKASTFDVDLKSKTLEDNILGKSPVIGTSAATYSASNVKMQENAIANFIADSVRTKMGADIGLFQSFAVRDSIEKGDITERSIDEVLPFIDAVHLVAVTGQDVLDALTVGTQTYVRQDRRPGILQVSGLTYTISPDGKPVNVMVKQNNGQYIPIDPNKEYKVAYDQYLIKGSEGFKSLARPMNVLNASYDCNADILKEAIKKLNFQPLQLKTENRIQILAKDPMASGDTPKALQKASSQNVAVAPVSQASQQQVQQQYQQQVNVRAPQLQPRVAYRMPMYPIMPPAYYYAQPPVIQPYYYAQPPVMQPMIPPPGYYYYATQGNAASPTSFVR